MRSCTHLSKPTFPLARHGSTKVWAHYTNKPVRSTATFTDLRTGVCPDCKLRSKRTHSHRSSTSPRSTQTVSMTTPKAHITPRRAIYATTVVRQTDHNL